MTSSSRANNFLRPIRSTPVISGSTGQGAPYQRQQQHDLWNFRESSVSSREGTPSSLRGIPAFEELPDRAISSRKLTNQKSPSSQPQVTVDAIREAAYVGSFPVDEATQEARAEYIKKHLTEKLNVKIAKPVLLAISLSGIKVCCGSGETVFMAHALKRISYATCQPEKCQFSFLAREPKAPTNVQYCHTFLTRRPSEAEDLNNIVANAFKTAYIQQQQQQPSTEPGHALSSFNDLIQSQIDRQNREFKLANERKQEQLRNQLNRISTPKIDSIAQQRRERQSSQKKVGEETEGNDDEEGDVLSWARNIVEQLSLPPTPRERGRHSSGRSIPLLFSSSDRISTLSEISDLCSTSEDLSIIDEFLFNLSNLPGSPVSAIKDFVERNFVTLFGGELAPMTSMMATLPPLHLPLPPHCRLAMPEDLSPLEFEEQHLVSMTSFSVGDGRSDVSTAPLQMSYESHKISKRRFDREDEDGDDEEEKDDEIETRDKITRERSLASVANNVENLSREYFSKNGRADELNDANLSEATWYQPGIPRDVALNKLLHQVNGTFVVRDSSTHPGCYALSIKVPKYDSPNEITHYLIVRTTRGTFKIKGLTKEWSSLTSLVLHHTIMRELLPCLLVLPPKQ